MIRPTPLFVLVVAAVGLATPALGQDVPVPRPGGSVFGGSRPSDPNNPDRATQQLSFRLDLAGGYDGSSGEQVITNEFNHAGLIGSSGGELHHRWGSSRTFLDSLARTHVSFAEVGLAQQTTGAAQIQGALPLSRRTDFNVQLNAAYQPTYLFNAFTPGLAQPLGAEAVNPVELTEGFTEERWLASSGTTQLARKWTPRQTTEVHYSSSQRTLLRAHDHYSNSQAAGLRHDWSFRERAAIGFAYQFDENRQRGNEASQVPVQSHRGNISMRITKRLPRGRAVSTSFGAGAAQSMSRPTPTRPTTTFVVPSATVRFQAQMSGAWAVALDGNRDVTMLEGLTLTPFVTDIASVSLNGQLWLGAQLTSTASYSHGVAKDGTTGEFNTMMSNVAILYPIGRIVSVSTSYSYYGHQLFDLPDLQAQLPSRQRRHSVRVGVRVWLPLFGSF